MAERVTRLWGLRRRPDLLFSVEAVGNAWGSTPADEIPELARALEREARDLGERITRDFPRVDFISVPPPVVVVSGVVGKDKFGPRTAHFLQVPMLFRATYELEVREALEATGLYSEGAA